MAFVTSYRLIYDVNNYGELPTNATQYSAVRVYTACCLLLFWMSANLSLNSAIMYERHFKVLVTNSKFGMALSVIYNMAKRGLILIKPK